MDLKDKEQKLDWAKIRERLGNGGPTYWKGLDELAGTDEFKEFLDDEFPHRKSLLDVDRRSFLKVMGASMALAGLAGCRKLPQERLVPHVKAPEDRVPGIREQYASSFDFGGIGFPILVDSKEGRPTKIEGHAIPGYSGRADLYAHAELLSMYDPDRAGVVLRDGMVSTWQEFIADCSPKLLRGRTAILMETKSSPTVNSLLGEVRKKNPNLAVYEFNTVDRSQSNVYADFDFRKNVILSLDADFLTGSPHSVRSAAEFAERRNPDHPKGMNRLYAVESSAGLTGAAADHRLAVKPSQVEAIAAAIAEACGVPVSGAPKLPATIPVAWINACAEDLKTGGLVVAGDHQTPFVHAMARAINTVLGNQSFAPYVGPGIEDLVRSIEAGEIDNLFILGGDPVYGAYGDLKFIESLMKVKTAVYIGTEVNDTGSACKWMAPESHFLESWGDTLSASDQTLIQQPLIAPLRDTRSLIGILSDLLGTPAEDDAIVQKRHGLSDKAWRKALHDGYLSESLITPGTGAQMPLPSPSATSGEIEAVFLPDPTIHDGRYANNGWLQELPKHLTKLVWDNAVIMGPNLAKKLGVKDEALVQITLGERSVKAPVYIQPGHADEVVTLHLGYGRKKGGKVLEGCGFDFAQLRTSKSPGFAPVTIEAVAGTHPLATTQIHHSMEGRDIIREGSVEEYKHNPSLHHAEHELEEKGFYNLTEEWAAANPDLPQWGMTIDLSTCIGCNSCVIACQSENNISTVGKLEAQRHRMLHWIRIDRYYRVHDGAEERDLETGVMNLGAGVESTKMQTLSGPIRDDVAMDPNTVTTVFQPIPCMHCEVAPCEPVCPVAATIHSHEGLNQMVYNRCVGTRYCSNNCPYKVRRFNYYNYQHGQTDPGLNKPYGQRNFQGEDDKPTLKLLHNPDVTVRSRGVMEKCTYCVQRINEARIASKKDDVPLVDGDVVTACQQSCPTGAITFGNVADPNSKVSKNKRLARNYSLLSELGTKPRTTYLGRVRNPHPALENA